ncbi:MAG: hypothetical protein CVV64_07790 [Candidatus Wallbacteria bacterium HGW-Wallbacteria-1]|uniref:Uncharacterized protein n=1 Tax=Candidatus Wallbacteria bacterium HGW-Wallbacteria-1 TaxID=2013854 RepID=A0A2N1PR11_9BACT|nr:MAG: hypothetical protein CVV64_07790 [Candidatus Wallbacteria bacterium HGW-Wallbacteria-1]
MYPEPLLKAAKAKGFDLESADSRPALSKELARDFFQKRLLQMLPSEAASMDTRVFLGFLAILAERRITLGHKSHGSPVAKNTDSSWITSCDITYINVRGSAPAGRKTGTFMDVARMLATIPSGAMLLAPFTHCCDDNIYSLNSHHLINPDCIDEELMANGFSGEDQLALLTSAAHLMDKAIGIEILPYTARFSIHALETPELFRWFKTDRDSTSKSLPNEKSKQDFHSMEKILGNRYQQIFHDTVRATVRRICIRAGLLTPDSEESLPPHSMLLGVQKDIINELMREGIWTLPCQAWTAIGLPEFTGMNGDEHKPLFKYLNGSGENRIEDADEHLTPVKLYHPVPVNRISSGRTKPEPFEEGIEFVTNLFPGYSKKFNFDFFRLQGVDRMMWSIVDSNPDFPSSDRLTPEIAATIIEKARSGKPYVAAIADRADDDIDKFRKVGFDLTMGWEQNSPLDSTILGTSIARARRISRLNELSFGDPKSSVMMAVDYHDVASPRKLGKSHSEIAGSRGMLLRYFAARFGSAGLGRRPVFDILGNQEMSHGFLDSTKSRNCLSWGRDRKFRDSLISMENIYHKFSHIFEGGDLSLYYFDNNFCYWYVDLAEEGKLSERVVCLVNPDHMRGPSIRNYLINVMDTADGRYRTVPAPSSLFEVNVENASMVKSPFVGGTFAFPKVGPGDMKMLYLTYRLIDSEAM